MAQLARWPLSRGAGHGTGKPKPVYPASVDATTPNPGWYFPIVSIRRTPGRRRETSRRINWADPPWPQIPVPTPVFPASHHRVVVDAPWRRGRYVDPPWTANTAPSSPSYPFSEIHARVRFQGTARARFTQPVPQQDRCPDRIARRPAAGLRARRGFTATTVPAQIPTPAWPPSNTHVRVYPHFRRRARFAEPGWPQGSQPVGSGLVQRTVVGVGL